MKFNTLYPHNHYSFTNLDTTDEVAMNLHYMARVYLKYNKAKEGNDPMVPQLNELFAKFFEHGNWDFMRPTIHNVDTEKFDNFYCNNTIFTNERENNKHCLIINLVSQGAHENRLLEPLSNTGYSNRFIEHDVPMIHVTEDPTRRPFWLCPANLLMGTNDTDCQDMDTLINKLKEIIPTMTENLERCMIIGDSKHAGTALLIAQLLSPIVTDAMILHGQNNYYYPTHPVAEDYNALVKRIDKRIGDWQDIHMDELIYYTLVKSAWYTDHFDQEFLDPFRYLGDYPDINVHYFYGKYDEQHRAFERYIKEFDYPNLTLHEIDHKNKDNPHFIKRHIERKYLPDIIKRLT